MRTLVSILMVLMTLGVACGAGPSPAGKRPLGFHIVYAGKIDGGRYIDTPDFPKLGYVNAVAPLEVKKLEAVTRDERRTDTTANGSSFHVRLAPEDAKRLAAITAQAVGKQMLVTLGDTPVIVVRVLNPITGPFVQLYFDERQDGARIEDALRALAA